MHFSMCTYIHCLSIYTVSLSHMPFFIYTHISDPYSFSCIPCAFSTCTYIHCLSIYTVQCLYPICLFSYIHISDPYSLFCIPCAFFRFNPKKERKKRMGLSLARMPFPICTHISILGSFAKETYDFKEPLIVATPYTYLQYLHI